MVDIVHEKAKIVVERLVGRVLYRHVHSRTRPGSYFFSECQPFTLSLLGLESPRAQSAFPITIVGHTHDRDLVVSDYRTLSFAVSTCRISEDCEQVALCVGPSLITLG